MTADREVRFSLEGLIMQHVRRANERGQADLGWLNSQHSFSFGSYHDPRFMGWGNLRVINEDVVQPSKGFATHRHQDMEIISYVLSGALAHKDSMGHEKVILPGQVQHMSAGTGVAHSEYNPSDAEAVHFLQIWLLPSQQGVKPSYAQVNVDRAALRGVLSVIGSPLASPADGATRALDHMVYMHADARIYAGLFDGSESTVLELDPSRKAYVHLVRGELVVNGERLQAGDALLLDQSEQLQFAQGREAEVLVFDLSA
jgi:redox-sensitive bicupin YhaK (pirin superfamily)